MPALTSRTAAVLLVGSRAALITAAWLGMRGQELGYDAAMHVALARAPFTGAGPYAQHPPLLSWLEGVPFGWLEPWLGSFIALRVVYALFECLAAALTYAAVRRLQGEASCTRTALVLLTFPCAWLSSTLLPQDEVIGYAFCAAALYALAHGRELLAVTVLASGVVAAKALLVIPLIVLVVLLPDSRPGLRVALALGPIVLVYGVLRLQHGHAASALLAFAPNAHFSVNAWSLLAEQAAPATLKYVSLAVATLLVVLHLAPLRRRTRLSHGQVYAWAFGALAWFFVGFYHVTPEYYALLLPAIALACVSPRRALFALGVVTLPWAVDLMHAIRMRTSRGFYEDARGQLAALYMHTVGLDPVIVHSLATLLTTLATAALAWTLTRTLTLTPHQRHAAARSRRS